MCWVIDNRTPADFFFSPLNLKAGSHGLAQLRTKVFPNPAGSAVLCSLPFHPNAWALGLQVAATLLDRQMGKGFQLLSPPMRKVSTFPGTSHHPWLTQAWGSPVQHQLTGTGAAEAGKGRITL